MSIEKFSLGDVEIEAIINGTGEIIILRCGFGDFNPASSFDDFTPLLNNVGYRPVAINLILNMGEFK